MTTIKLSDREKFERTCPKCKKVTDRHSIDGGLTSIFHGECGHSWKVTPFGKEPTDETGKEGG